MRLVSAGAAAPPAPARVHRRAWSGWTGARPARHPFTNRCDSRFTARVVYQDAGAAGSSYWRCYLTVNGDLTGAATVSAIGPDTVTAGSFAVQQGVSLSAPSTIRVVCQHDGPTPAGNPRVDHGQLTAIRTENLVVQ